MNKGELVDAVEGRLGSRRAASDAVEVVVDTVVRAVVRGERVAISGFGTFERADRAPRTGRNPRTGETVPIEGTSVPRFRPGTAFRDLVAEPGSLPDEVLAHDGPGGSLRASTTRRSAVEAPVERRRRTPARSTAPASTSEDPAPAAAADLSTGPSAQKGSGRKSAKKAKAADRDAEKDRSTDKDAARSSGKKSDRAGGKSGKKSGKKGK